MSNRDQAIKQSLQQAQEKADGVAPDFTTVFGAAERQIRSRSRKRYGGLAAAAVVMAIALSLIPSRKDEVTYVDVEELMATTSWSAPSDALLPRHQFDIYRELPKLFDSPATSTIDDEGALL